MSKPIVTVENLGKAYRLGVVGVGSLREDLGQAWHKLIGKPLPPIVRKHTAGVDPRRMGEDGRFWALRDVSFQVEQGQVMGIIGRNGAGKSTLLKILSRITEPTKGMVTMDGRTASLLEVGTGFHPELTGRENVFLNGVMLGLRRKEVQAKFDEIVEFSGVGPFLDTPVKRYSSGMYVRLAFAVAAHLEPDILIVDEVLTVGDLAFQQKCLGKMKEVTGQGRTVFFVSHTMHAVKSLCHRCVLLEGGTVAYDGDPVNAVQEYRDMLANKNLGEGFGLDDESIRRGDGQARFDSVTVTNDKDEPAHVFEPGQTVRFHLHFTVKEPVKSLSAAVVLLSAKDHGSVTSAFRCLSETDVPPGKACVILEMKDNILRVGEFPLYFWLGDTQFAPYDVVEDVHQPLTIASRRGALELGYNPAHPNGYFTHPSTLIKAELPS